MQGSVVCKKHKAALPMPVLEPSTVGALAETCKPRAKDLFSGLCKDTSSSSENKLPSLEAPALEATENMMPIGVPLKLSPEDQERTRVLDAEESRKAEEDRKQLRLSLTAGRVHGPTNQRIVVAPKIRLARAEEAVVASEGKDAEIIKIRDAVRLEVLEIEKKKDDEFKGV